MASIKTGARPHKQKERQTLTVTPLLVKTTLSGCDFQLRHITSATHFYNGLVRDRNRWSIEQHRRGLFGTGKIDKAKANERLKAGLAALKRSAQ